MQSYLSTLQTYAVQSTGDKVANVYRTALLRTISGIFHYSYQYSFSIRQISVRSTFATLSPVEYTA